MKSRTRKWSSEDMNRRGREFLMLPRELTIMMALSTTTRTRVRNTVTQTHTKYICIHLMAPLRTTMATIWQISHASLTPTVTKAGNTKSSLPNSHERPQATKAGITEDAFTKLRSS